MINDNFGHAVGDSLIQTMSEKLLAVSNERCRTYRVGGDEFLLILDDPAPGEINRIIQQVKTELSSGTGTTGLRILAAVGSAEGCGADIRSLVKKQMPPCIQTRQRARRADHDLYSYSMFSFGISFVFTSYLLYRGVFYYPQKSMSTRTRYRMTCSMPLIKMLCSIFSMKWSRLPMKKFLSSHRMVCLCAADFICFVRMHRLCSFSWISWNFSLGWSGIFSLLQENHINLLVVDERSHGKSADQIITFGIRECKDVKCWADYAAKRFPENP